MSTNSSPALVADMNDLAVKYLNGAMVYMRDIGHVRDGYVVQQNTVQADALTFTQPLLRGFGAAINRR